MQPTNPTSLPPYTGTLTREHLAVVRAERDRWLRVGLSTTPADRPAAAAAVRVAYAAAGLRPPGIVVWMDSPLAGCLAVVTHPQLHGQLHGPWWQPYWLATYRCALRIAGLEPSPRLDALADAVAHLGDWWPLRGAVVLTDRPTTLSRDAQGRLHAEAGPALAWADGFAVHAIHGVRVPAPVVETPDMITVDYIHDEPDVEVRRVLLDRYGHARFLRDVGAEQVHADQFGTLWRRRLPDDEDLVMVEVANATPEPDGTARTYWLRVPPGMRTARQAVAWTFGLDEGDYHPTAQT